MSKFAYYLLNESGIVINEIEDKSFEHIELPLCPDISKYIWNGEKWIINEEKQKENRIKKINILLDKNKQSLIENKVIYTEQDSNFTVYEEKYRNERKSLLDELKNIL